MERNNIIIIALIAIIAIIAVCMGYMLLNPSIEYETLHISNGSSIEVPKADDASWNQDSNGIKTFTCESKHTTLMSFNSQEDLSLVGAGAFAIARDYLLTGAKDVEIYKDYQIKENTINGTHFYIVSISSNETHDNIVIGCENLDILKHMLDSLVLGKPGDGPSNATLSGSSTPVQTGSSANNDTSDKNKYSEDDLRRASQEGYNNGYSDALDDSNYNDNYYGDYDNAGIDSNYLSTHQQRVVNGSLE